MTGEIEHFDDSLYLSILQRKYPWVFCGAQLVVVVHDSTIGLFSKPLDTLTLRVCSKEVQDLVMHDQITQQGVKPFCNTIFFFFNYLVGP